MVTFRRWDKTNVASPSQQYFLCANHPCPLFQERLKATEHRPEMEDKADKRTTEPKPRPSPISSTSPLPVMHPHKRRPPSRSPTPSTSSLTPLPSVPSPVTALKSEDGGHRALSHPPTPLAHPASPRSASPPPSSPRQPKQEAEEGAAGQREQRDAQKPPSGPFQGLYSGEWRESSTILLFGLVGS